MMGQKDAHGFLEHFRGLVRRVVTVPIPGGPEAAHDPGELAAIAASIGFNAEPAADVETRDPPPAGASRRSRCAS